MKLFITGTTGYIGQKLMLAALNKGYDVNALVRDPNSPHLYRHQNLLYHNGDITDYSSVLSAMLGCDVVMHAAGITKLWDKDRSIFYKVNVGGTKNILDAACHHNIKKVVYTSTCAVLGPSFQHPVLEEDPRVTPFENDYEISKHCAEELVREYSRRGLFTIIVAPPRVYGPGLWTNGNPISKLMQGIIKRKLAFIPGAKNILGNYAFIDDVVEGHFLAMEKGLGGEKYILGGENLSYNDFFGTIQEVADIRIRFITVSKPLLKIAGGIAYTTSLITGQHLHLTPKIIDRLFQNRAVNCDKAVRQLGYHITPFKSGVRQTLQFLKARNYV